MRILVTGGAGFIGSRLVKRLLDLGQTVRVLDNFSTGCRDRVPKNVELLEGDACDVAGDAVRNVDLVYHLAAIPWIQYSINHPTEAWRANAESTQAIVKEAAAAGVMRVVFSSTCAVYGEGRGMRPVSAYGQAKLKAEEYCRQYGLETVILRFFNVYSHEEEAGSVYSRVIPLFVKQATSGQPITVNGDGFQTRDFVHLNDIITVLIAAGHRDGISERPIDVGTGRPISILDLALAISALAGGDRTIVHQPSLPGEIRSVQPDIRDMEVLLGRGAIPIQEGLRLFFPGQKT